VQDHLVFDAGSRDQWVPGMRQWTAGEELEQEERDVEHDVQHEEAVYDPQEDRSSVEGAVVRNEDASDLQDDGDFQGNDDEGVDCDRYMEELGYDSVSHGAEDHGKEVTYAGMHHRFPSSEIPLMYTQRQGFKHEDDDMEARKAEPGYYQPIWITSQKIYLLDTFSIHNCDKTHNPQPAYSSQRPAWCTPSSPPPPSQ
jgi:hypothetical protein